MSLLDPTDRDLAKKRAVEAAEADCDPAAVDSYIKDHPSLDSAGFPIDPLAEAYASWMYDDSAYAVDEEN